MDENNIGFAPVPIPPKLSITENKPRFNLEDIINDCLPQEELQPFFFDASKIDAVLIFSQKYIGQPDELGYELLESFITELQVLERIPNDIIFLHKAVELCTDSSPLLSCLQRLQDRGCRIKFCENSAQFFGLQDDIHVGSSASPADIINICLTSKKVIRF